jgi:drug/metabolite transporter (DMT)-like permease
MLLVALGAVLFACKGLFAKTLYAKGVDAAPLVALRALIALPFFWAVAVWREGRAAWALPPLKPMFYAASAGFICYYVGALLNFRALELIDASIERVLLFSYPAFVVFASAALERKRPAPAVLLAVALTWAGIFLAAGGLADGELHANAVGGVLTILSGLSYGVYFLLGARFTQELGSARFTIYAMTASAAGLTAHVLVTGAFREVFQYDESSWWLLFGIGTFSMALPALLQAEGLRLAGAVRGAIVSTVGPPTTIVLAWWLLGERLVASQLLGMLLIVGGILLLEMRRLSSQRTSMPAGPDST